MNTCKKAEPAASPVGSKVRHCVFELRCLSQGMPEEKFNKLKVIINNLEGCALHMEEIEQHIPVSLFSPPIDSGQIAAELGARMEN
ncbi:hypothetical protein [Desulfovibrio gilichinskyi]|uniref:Uncharacterized protein n=1 Tax=Desulfovibrio gilichinskyi TaxID=1519643 RepID=A0A1X7F1Z2_9BACT|nr:hypothetical protein [Desulfovibrio gilichinskyi]SMF44509.1 hypothetical protein SAMN06295933_3606 [Desulfovibrio gilichinskyi]